MARRQRDSDFDQRVDWEIIVDANGPEEQALGWYYYLENHLQFPVRARCRSKRPTSPLSVGQAVEVHGMPAEDVCRHEMFVNIAWQEELLAVPLAQLSAVDVDDETEQAIQDWHTWVKRGYEL